MKIRSSKDIRKSVLECDDIHSLFHITDLVLSNEIYCKDEVLKKTIIQRLKYLIQKDKYLPSTGHLHNILFTKNIKNTSFGYEIYELYINCILSKSNFNNTALPIDDFSFITFILFMDIDLYLETENYELKKFCNESIKKLIIYIAKIYDIYPKNEGLNNLLNKYRYITCDDLFKAISKCDYKIIIRNNQKCISKDNDYELESTMKKIYKKIEEIFNYIDKKKEFVDKIAFLSTKTKNLFYAINKIEREFDKKYGGIALYIDFIYGTFINFPFDEPIDKIKDSLERIVKNIALNLKNDYFSFIKFGYVEPVYVDSFDSALIINGVISAICEFKSYRVETQMAKIENIVHNICYETENKSKDELFALESIQFQSMDSALEAYKKYSGKIQRGQNKVYNAYKKYKIHEDKIDSQATKAVRFLKKMVLGDKREELIEGKKFTPIGLIKKLLGGYVAFSIAPVITILALAVRFGLSKKTTNRERKKLIMELETELQLLDEKINDARGASDNKAKYSLMRTRSEVNNAIKKLKFGIEADERSKSSAKRILDK